MTAPIPSMSEPTQSKDLAAEMSKYGITKKSVDHYFFRDYRYTSLHDALNHAKRTIGNMTTDTVHVATWQGDNPAETTVIGHACFVVLDCHASWLTVMTLEFPNKSRSFEALKNRVRFWGYDRTIEVTFFMEADALAKICPKVGATETSLLNAFDSTVERIHNIAREVYGRNRVHSYAYVLAAKDFWGWAAESGPAILPLSRMTLERHVAGSDKSGIGVADGTWTHDL